MGFTPRIAVNRRRSRAGLGVPYALLVRELACILAEGAPDVNSALLPHALVVAEAAAYIVVVRQVLRYVVPCVEVGGDGGRAGDGGDCGCCVIS